ncbi:MAG TPA: hypothetical protein VN714_25550 [Trebonia sp.]|nr:hypothetical protein [Trebonia sp.]
MSLADSDHPAEIQRLASRELLADTALRRSGRDIDDAVRAHIWRIHDENIHFYGSHFVDVADEFTKLGSHGDRPLRSTAVQYG